MCFMGAAKGVSDQSYMSLGHKISYKGGSSQCFEERGTVVHKEENTKAFHWLEMAKSAWRWGQEKYDSYIEVKIFAYRTKDEWSWGLYLTV